MAAAPKKPVTFEDALDALMRRYGVADYAFAATRSDGARLSGWQAGEGRDRLADEGRIAVLGMGLDIVKREMVDYCMTPREEAKNEES